MARSQGQRSASASGMPDRIFSMFAAGWKSSPSAVHGDRFVVAEAEKTESLDELRHVLRN